jgi:predicted RNase H-like nuclease
MWVAGIDGCRGGWIVAFRNLDSEAWHFRFARTLAEIVDADEQPGIIAIDMPTGFAECAERGGRACERAARALLMGKTSSVFPTPCRAALDGATHREAGALNRGSGPDGVGLTRQAFHLFPKMRELDALLRERPTLCQRVFEAHPELAFLRMNNGRPVLPPKRTRPGHVQRRRLLARHGFPSAETQWLAWRRQVGLPASDAALDDALDAAAVCRTALLIHRGEASHLPERIECDRHGLPMAIWY